MNDLHTLWESLWNAACREYRSTSQYLCNKDRLEQMLRGCLFNVCESDREFTLECFRVLAAAAEEERRWFYHRAFSQCTALLKELGVLN